MQKLNAKHIKLFGLSFLTAIIIAVIIYLALMPDIERENVNAYLGDVNAEYAMAKRLASGDGVPEDDKAAVELFRKAGEQGQVQACLTMARLYFTGDGVEKDDKAGAEWLKKAAEGGSSFAQALMGLLYIGGIGVKQDVDQAVNWLGRSQELEADQMMKDLQRNMDRINALPIDDREAAWDTFYARRKLMTGENFARLMKKMKQHENEGDE